MVLHKYMLTLHCHKLYYISSGPVAGWWLQDCQSGHLTCLQTDQWTPTCSYWSTQSLWESGIRRRSGTHTVTLCVQVVTKIYLQCVLSVLWVWMLMLCLFKNFSEALEFGYLTDPKALFNLSVILGLKDLLMNSLIHWVDWSYVCLINQSKNMCNPFYIYKLSMDWNLVWLTKISVIELCVWVIDQYWLKGECECECLILIVLLFGILFMDVDLSQWCYEYIWNDVMLNLCLKGEPSTEHSAEADGVAWRTGPDDESYVWSVQKWWSRGQLWDNSIYSHTAFSSSLSSCFNSVLSQSFFLIKRN